MAAIQTGDLAPDVIFPTHTGDRLTLESYRGRKVVVVYFYPKDYTPICTREACAFRDAHDEFLGAGAAVIGVSSDSDRSHYAFVRLHRLPFYLVSDVDGSIRNAFGVPKTMGVLPGRVTYVIDKQGIVRHIFSAQFFADRHAQEALNVVRRLEQEVSKTNS